jgi:hypothetical protein
MNATKGLAIGAGVLVVAWHLLAIAKDVEQWQVNYRRWQADPSNENALKVLLAEGMLVKDVGGLL